MMVELPTPESGWLWWWRRRRSGREGEEEREGKEEEKKKEEEEEEKDNIMEEEIKCVSELKKMNCRFCFSYFSKLKHRMCPATDESCM